MAKRKICLGCFQEWDSEWEQCPVCGYRMEETDVTDQSKNSISGWKLGDILTKRFLIGKQYEAFEQYEAWRAYDAYLEIRCFLYVGKEENSDLLLQMADMMKGKEENDAVKIMQFSSFGSRCVLVTSFQSENDIEQFAGIRKSVEEQNDIKHTIVNEVNIKDTKQGENALTEDTFLNGHYRIVGSLGIGGFGITYLCEDINLGRNVAVKEYFPFEWAVREEKFVTVKSSGLLQPYLFGKEAFAKEAKMTAKFIHSAGIVTVYDYFEENDTAYLVMEYVQGESLGKSMKHAVAEIKPEKMSEILLPVLDSLERLHERKIVHSDISPGNIMVTPKGKMVLIDLGAAKYWYDTKPNLSAAFLKPDFAAPEQYRTAKVGIPKDEGPWTDIYAIGATMYYMLTGHKPLDVITRLEGETTSLVSPKKYKVKIKKRWMKIMEKCMEVDYTKRYVSVYELKHAIEESL